METAVLTQEHQQFLDGLRSEVSDATVKLDAKRDYLRSVRGMAKEVDSIATMQHGVKADLDSITKADDAIGRIERLLALGFEPTTPPDWYCGHLSKPKVERDETWPRKDKPAGTTRTVDNSLSWGFSFTFFEGASYRTYKGAIPAEAVRRYATAKPLLDDARIYSPRKEDFEFVSLEPADPVLIGSVEVLGQPCYFEIARWDIDRDLAEVFAS